MNVQVTIKLQQITDSIENNNITMTYKPTEIQTFHNIKDLNELLEIGKKNDLSEVLGKFNDFLKGSVNIGEKLESLKVENVKSELFNKKIFVNKLLNSISRQKLNKIIQFLTNLFITNSEFYDFSLGLLEFIQKKIKFDLNNDFAKIKRRINDSWIATITVESIETYSYCQKSTMFSFKDNYNFKIADIGGIDKLIDKISEIFVNSLEPYIDVSMEKIITDTFKKIQYYSDNQYSIYSHLERIAWEIDNLKLDNSEILRNFNDLCEAYFNLFSENQYCGVLPPLNNSFVRQHTVATTESKNFEPIGKINFNDLRTYHNSYQHKIISLQKNELPLPKSMEINEINETISKCKRYLNIISLGEKFISEILEEHDTATNLKDSVNIFEIKINQLIDEICIFYNEEPELIS